ncbi:S-adenosylmethionine synthetase [Lachnospiraceae bacterium KM106-2]|nr:S-adenosylmethionine synthetase [Lachnospiraceae bacterium KM106-2]
MKEYLVTSESVAAGHPDKLCDQISDGILDAYLRIDKNARVAVETMASKNTVMIAGEVTAKGTVDVIKVARNIIKEIGYTSNECGLDYKNCLILTNLNTQSPDIALGVTKTSTDNTLIGGGDQGIMYGYAVDETANYMPYTCELAHRLVMRLDHVRKEGIVPFLYPDGKAQVTMRYDQYDHPVRLESIVLSAQHHPSIQHEYLENVLMEEVIRPVTGGRFLKGDTKIHINPTGRFVIGGPAGDTGLTGRKIIVDTYGGVAKHGGGAFSGKDATKVDRCAAYMARYVAKNVVAAKLASKCEIAIAYVIGGIEPESITINTFGTETISLSIIEEIVKESFSFSVSNIIKGLNLQRPQFQRTAVYGHFGREQEGFRWEATDMVDTLREKAARRVYESLC